MTIAYFTERLQTSLMMAEASPDKSARRAHLGLARLYRARIAASPTLEPSDAPLFSLGG